MLTRPLDPIAKDILRRAGKVRLVARLTVLLGKGQITCRKAARMLAAYREQIGSK